MHNTPLIPVILCGGAGSRLWPLSRTHSPKQFLPLADDTLSMFQQTVMRAKKLSTEKIIIVSNQEHRFMVAQQLHALDISADIILEPEGRNTAAAITAAAIHARSHDPQSSLMVLPSDHIIKQEQLFLEAAQHALNIVSHNHLVTFGITPDYPETGFGYIKYGSQVADTAGFHIEQFVEKPNAKTAQAYLDQGSYLWNSGMFMFPVSVFCDEIQTHEPDIYQAVKQSVDNASQDHDFIRLDKQSFLSSPSIPVDIAVMERTKHAAVVPLSCGWNDAGAWDALWRVHDKDENGNVMRGCAVQHDTNNNYFHAMDDAPAIAAVGVENLAVISTSDVVLVAKQSEAQKVKTLLQKARKHYEIWGDYHNRVDRPWGDYEILLPSTPQEKTEKPCKVKHIHVRPKEKLSVQMHHHRAEHWVIVQGSARVVVDKKEHLLSRGDYVFIPQKAVHYIENTGDQELYFVEVQTGDYLGEDDIVRFEDKYGRV